LVAKWSTIKVVSAFVGSKGWKVHHLDMEMAFLSGHLHDEVYMQ
jgi:hypothetical protein